MKFFLSARYGRRHELRLVAEQLRGLGHQVTSRWIDSDHWLLDEAENAQDVVVPAAPDFACRLATRDRLDLAGAECLVLWTEEPGVRDRGERHVAFGMAVGMRKLVLLIGPRENLFHHLPATPAMADAAELLDAVGRNEVPP